MKSVKTTPEVDSHPWPCKTALFCYCKNGKEMDLWIKVNPLNHLPKKAVLEGKEIKRGGMILGDSVLMQTKFSEHTLVTKTISIERSLHFLEILP